MANSSHQDTSAHIVKSDLHNIQFQSKLMKRFDSIIFSQMNVGINFAQIKIPTNNTWNLKIINVGQKQLFWFRSNTKTETKIVWYFRLIL